MTYPKVATLKPEELKTLCDTFRKNNFIDPEISAELGVKRGLRNEDGTGVLAGLTNVCDVVGYDTHEDGTITPAKGKLYYRGYDVEELVQEALTYDRFIFEEVSWLLLLGSLPTQEELDQFVSILDSHRELPDGFAEEMIMSAPSPNVMNLMARSVLAMYSYDDDAEDTSVENILRQSINLIAQLPTLMVYSYETKRHVYDRKSMYYHYPIYGLSTAEHILSTYRPDQKYSHEEAKLLDLCMVVHADHGGGNCSTFSNRVLSSSMTDTYASISAAIGALKGPRHGGANISVMRQLDGFMEEYDHSVDENKVKEYLRGVVRKEKGDGSGLIYGIGHAVYTESDPRAQILKDQSHSLAKEKGMEDLWEALCLMEKVAPEVLKEEKGQTSHVCANVDMFSGLVYRLLGFKTELFTPLFAVARIPGWCAHRMEEVEFANRIIRPAYKCLGEIRPYVSMTKRK